MFRRFTAVASLVIALLATTVPNASAGLSTGACVISLTFDFSGSVGLATAPGYTFSGGGTCAATLAAAPASVEQTFISGSGSSIAWNCAGAVALGFWDQQFSSGAPAEAHGSFVLGPANGAYVLTITAGNLVGTAQMTTIDAVAVGTCPIDSAERLTLVGTMEFQDP